MKIYNFRGDLTNISAKIEALIGSPVILVKLQSLEIQSYKNKDTEWDEIVDKYV